MPAISVIELSRTIIVQLGHGVKVKHGTERKVARVSDIITVRKRLFGERHLGTQPYLTPPP